MMMMMMMGPAEDVGGGDTAEQGEAEEGGDTLEGEVESGWEDSPMEQEGCKAVALQQQEQAPNGFLFLTAEEKAETAVQVKRSLADSKAVSMLSQSMVVAEAESRRSQKQQERRPHGRAAVLPTRGMQKVGGGDTVEQGGAEGGNDNLEEAVPGAGAGAGVGQMVMLEGSEEEVGGDDTVEESGAEEGGYDLEEGVELSTEEEGTGAEAAGEAGQCRWWSMVV